VGDLKAFIHLAPNNDVCIQPHVHACCCCGGEH